jgi:hypothetical protein
MFRSLATSKSYPFVFLISAVLLELAAEASLAARTSLFVGDDVDKIDDVKDDVTCFLQLAGTPAVRTGFAPAPPAQSALTFRAPAPAPSIVPPGPHALQSQSMLKLDDTVDATPLAGFPAPAPPAKSALNTRPDPLPVHELLPSQEGLLSRQAVAAAATRAEVCVTREDLSKTLTETREAVLHKGLPRWNHSEIPAQKPDVRIGFLTQVAFEDQLLLLRRTFGHIYSPSDHFLYLVDESKLHPSRVRAMLPNPPPSNVEVKTVPHAGYFYWPRVQIFLDGIRDLLEQPVDFVVHLSESDYPLHSVNWLRTSLAQQRRRNFISLTPRCTSESKGAVDDWYWWGQNDAVASCGRVSRASPMTGVHFDLERAEERGFRFARAPEWVVLTRELAEYAVSPELASFRRFIGLHAAADEIFWGTLVLNIPGFNVSEEIGTQNWFEKWQPGSVGHSPETLTADQEGEVLAHRERHFFLRKVNRVDSGQLLSHIDGLLAMADPVTDPPYAGEAWTGTAIACPR